MPTYSNQLIFRSTASLKFLIIFGEEYKKDTT